VKALVNELHPYIARYDVQTKEEKSADSVFITLTDNGTAHLPPIIVHFVKNQIYAVNFANNEFFEIPNEQLYHVLKAILAGEYDIKTTLFKRSKYIVASYGNEIITPERTHKAVNDDYDNLPLSFTKK
jgi:hypothetical protein